MKRKIIVQFKFTTEEAAIARAKNPSTKACKVSFCDAQNFYLFDFDGAEIFAGDTSDKTEWLIAKAKGEMPKPLKAKAK